MAADWSTEDAAYQQVKNDSRAKLAYLITGPQNERFAGSGSESSLAKTYRCWASRTAA
jgi:hypothetical protein